MQIGIRGESRTFFFYLFNVVREYFSTFSPFSQEIINLDEEEANFGNWYLWVLLLDWIEADCWALVEVSARLSDFSISKIFIRTNLPQVFKTVAKVLKSSYTPTGWLLFINPTSSELINMSNYTIHQKFRWYKMKTHSGKSSANHT